MQLAVELPVLHLNFGGLKKRKMAQPPTPRSISKPKTLSSNILADLIRNSLDKILVIDSRSFIEYNSSHIMNSVNIGCSKLIKRRLEQDKVTVKELLANICKIDTDETCQVIVYDQCTEDISGIDREHFLSVLLSKLTGSFNQVSVLTGGFMKFQSYFPGLCESQTEAVAASRCGAFASLSQPCLPVSNLGPTRILPFLYLGSQQDVLNREAVTGHGIKYVLNVSRNCPKPAFIKESHFCRVPVNDSYGDKILPHLGQAFKFIDKVRSANGCVIVHCLGGVSRSATIAIAYVMKHQKMSLDDAYKYVKDKRPTISPNFNFMGQLMEFEGQLKQQQAGEGAVVTSQPASLQLPPSFHGGGSGLNGGNPSSPSECKRSRVHSMGGGASAQRPTGLQLSQQFLGPYYTAPASVKSRKARSPTGAGSSRSPRGSPKSKSPGGAGGAQLRPFSFASALKCNLPASGHPGRATDTARKVPTTPEILQVDQLTSALSVHSPEVRADNPLIQQIKLLQEQQQESRPPQPQQAKAQLQPQAQQPQVQPRAKAELQPQAPRIQLPAQAELPPQAQPRTQQQQAKLQSQLKPPPAKPQPQLKLGRAGEAGGEVVHGKSTLKNIFLKSSLKKSSSSSSSPGKPKSFFSGGLSAMTKWAKSERAATADSSSISQAEEAGGKKAAASTPPPSSAIRKSQSAHVIRYPHPHHHHHHHHHHHQQHHPATSAGRSTYGANSQTVAWPGGESATAAAVYSLAKCNKEPQRSCSEEELSDDSGHSLSGQRSLSSSCEMIEVQ